MDGVLILTEYILIIDTDSPSYEFASDLCAFCTGYAEENSMKMSMIDSFYENLNLKSDISVAQKIESNPFRGFVVDKIDQYGYFSPFCIWLNKRYGCNESGEYGLLTQDNYEKFTMPAPFSVGIFFEREPEQEHIDLIVKRANLFFDSVWRNKKVKIDGMRVITHTKYAKEKVLF